MRNDKPDEVGTRQSLHGKIFEKLESSILGGGYKCGDMLKNTYI
jgi:DNA-binding FadR family transcriptional regulator